MGFNCLKATEQPLGDSFLLNTKSLGVTGTHLICLGKMKGQCFLLFFCESFRDLSLSRKFAQFSIKAVHVTMVGENFEIYSVHITRKYICDSKIENRNFYSCPQAKLSSGSHYHLHTNIVPPLAERGERKLCGLSDFRKVLPYQGLF